MKIDGTKSIITILLCALLAYGFYAICDVQELKWLLCISSFLTTAVTGLFTIGVSLTAERTSMMFKAFSGIAFGIFIIMNLIFSFIDFNIPFYVIINGLLLLIYALAAVSMSRIKE